MNNSWSWDQIPDGWEGCASLESHCEAIESILQSHQLVVINDCQIAKILRKHELDRRMITWSIKLFEFGLRYKAGGPIKSQCLADFATELQYYLNVEGGWILYVDVSSSKRGSGSRIVLKEHVDVKIEQSLVFKFKTSNNQVEYQTLMVGLTLAEDVGVKKVSCKAYSQLMIFQLKGEFQVKKPSYSSIITWLRRRWSVLMKSILSMFPERKILA